MNFEDYIIDQIEFSAKTFGPGKRTGGVLDHIRKEIEEIAANPGDLEEWIDLIILAIDGAWRRGWSPDQIANALADKQAKNRARTWPDWRGFSEDKAIEHDRTGETPEKLRKEWEEAYAADPRPHVIGHHTTNAKPDPGMFALGKSNMEFIPEPDPDLMAALEKSLQKEQGPRFGETVDEWRERRRRESAWRPGTRAEEELG